MNDITDIASRLYPSHAAETRQHREAERVREQHAQREPDLELLYGPDAVRRAMVRGRDRSDDPLAKALYWQPRG